MAPVVSLNAAVAVTGRFPVLAGADLVVDQGQVVVLDGANGAGKTSLLRVCAGLLPVTGGHAVVLGCDLRRRPQSVRRRVGVLGHAAALYDDLPVLDNARFAVRAAGGVVAAVDPALERLGLIGRLRRTPVGKLSAGQRRRVALAVLVARRPELWLLDEPHAALDADTRALLGELVEEAASAGATVLVASHDPTVSEPMADRVVTLGGGRVVDERPGRRHSAAGMAGPAATASAGQVPVVSPAGEAPVVSPAGEVPVVSPAGQVPVVSSAGQAPASLGGIHVA